VNGALVVSNVLLWIALVVLAGVVVALARQIGVLHERVAPAGALLLGGGPRVGEAAPAFAGRDLFDRVVRIGGPDDAGHSTGRSAASPRPTVSPRFRTWCPPTSGSPTRSAVSPTRC
jgi:methylamine dehydrogenase accessory protein MauD